MEFLALGGLILYGLSQNKEENIIDPILPSKNTTSKTSRSKSIPTKDNQIHSYIDQEHHNLMENNYPIVDNVLDALPESSYINNKEPTNTNAGFESMFEPIAIKNNGIVKSVNEPPISNNTEDQRFKRELDYMEGFSDFNDTSMDYGVTNDFKHNNMTPSTTMRDTPLMNYDNLNRKLDLWTGSSKNWTPKKEVEKMFAPTKHGRNTLENKPTINGQLGSRFITTFKNNMGNLPFQNKVKVKPGIDGNNQEGRHNTYRVLPRNIDELRSETNQKLTYKQPVIESGKKGRLPTKIGLQQSLKNLYDAREIQEGKSKYSKSVPRAKLTHKVSDNRATKINYQGPAIRTQTGNAVHGIYEPTGKQNFKSDSIVRNLADESKGHNVVRKSIQQYATNRDTTTHTISGSAFQSQSTYSNLQDKARPTIKQSTSYSREGSTKPMYEQSIYANLQDEAKPTIKQTTLYSHEGNTNPFSHSTYTNLQDEAKPTIKQTTLHSREGNTNPYSHSTYTNLQDEAKPTIKQTTLHSREGNTNPFRHSTYSNLQDGAKATIKQTTLHSREGNTNPLSHSTYSNLQDEAKATIKQTTLHSREGYTNPLSHSTYSNLQDEAKATIKQTTLHSREGNTQSVYDHATYSNLQDKARPTIKHSTLYSQEGNVKSAINNSTYTELTDKAKQTIKETTLTSKEFHLRGNDKSYVIDKHFKAKPTIKHSTLFATPEINPTRPGQSVDRQVIMDKARKTIKETTLLEGHVKPLGNVDKKARVYDDALNMQIDDCKEQILKSRPNPGGDQKYRKYYTKSSDTRKKLFTNASREPNISRPLDYQTPDSHLTNQTRNKDSTVLNNYRITNNYINTLKDNPLVNDLRHQKNINYTL
ncbi:hypothetical protein crov185 [Cafeteria roenbergensis virus]|uniref:Uncharacterized protein n=1 Tax=Cafeteria roenbergensis virus (strain BV-PW1) TaxID=693272 RepID=E3T4V5_CROVB|nr:hypothetical protein crov185 [Cafeteria roenbergensis virus BV-PW1]ADO67218.1 hypothetical protein crov185 [Cafeteria roenbergensis virus BV-PW1]